MFDREKFREKIAAQLKDVPTDKCVAFAVRSAMRVLPLLAVPNKEDSPSNVSAGQNSEAFWYWKAEDRNKYLLAVLRVYSRSIEYVLTEQLSDHYYAAAFEGSAYAAGFAANIYSTTVTYNLTVDYSYPYAATLASASAAASAVTNIYSPPVPYSHPWVPTLPELPPPIPIPL